MNICTFYLFKSVPAACLGQNDCLQPQRLRSAASLCLQAHLVAAFEKSLSNMTCRLQSLTMTAEQKVPELCPEFKPECI